MRHPPPPASPARDPVGGRGRFSRGGRCGAFLLALAIWPATVSGRDLALFQATFDVARECLLDAGVAFSRRWEVETGDRLSAVLSTVSGREGGEGLAVADAGDVLLLASSRDLDDVVSRTDLVTPGWRERLPGGGVPFTSVVVFVVRPGNPKQIRDWDDLVGRELRVVTADPRTSTVGRWVYLAAWAAARRAKGDEGGALRWMRGLGGNLAVLDPTARGASTAFARQESGDVLITLESEGFGISRERSAFEIVRPAFSLVVEPAVTWVDHNVRRHGSLGIAQAYLEFLFSEAGQEVAARHGFRPRDAGVLRRHADRFPPLETATIDDAFGGWGRVEEASFPGREAGDWVWPK